MPMIHLNLDAQRSHWTKLPNYLVDQVMPTLKDTELRVLLVIVRQTIGYNRPSKPISISLNALTAKTGRESSAVSRALHSLATMKLIHIVAGKNR